MLTASLHNSQSFMIGFLTQLSFMRPKLISAVFIRQRLIWPFLFYILIKFVSNVTVQQNINGIHLTCLLFTLEHVLKSKPTGLRTVCNPR